MSAAAQDSSLGAQAAEGSPGADLATSAAASPRKRAALLSAAPTLDGEAGKQQLQQAHEQEEERPQQPRQQRGRPLSFSRWFAQQARATDIVFVLAEVLLINWLHAVRLGEALQCGAEGGQGAAGSSGASSGSSTFPCGGGLQSKLLWSLSSGAVLDPVLRLRMWDYGNLLYTWSQLLIVLVALTRPAAYERSRHALMGAVSAAALLGVHLALRWAPSGPLPSNSAALLSAERHRAVAIYVGWKSATVFRVPAADQLVIGPLLWLLAVTALPLADRRMPPPGTGGGGEHSSADGCRILVHSLLLFVVVAALPYLLCRFWEARALRPEYGKYLRDWARAAGGPSTARDGGGGEAGDSSTADDSRHLRFCVAGQGGAADGAASRLLTHAVATALAAATTRLLIEAASPVDSHSSQASRTQNATALYRSRAAVVGGRLGRSCSHTALLSFKVPVSHRSSKPGASSPVGGDELPTFEEASAEVLRGAAAALDAHNNCAAGLAAAGAGAGGGAAGASPHAAAVPLRCLSAVCVRGCVQLLMVLHLMAAAAPADGQQDAEGQEQPCVQQLSPPQLLHVVMDEDAACETSVEAASSDGGGGRTELAVAAAAAAAMQQLLAHAGETADAPAGDAAAASTSSTSTDSSSSFADAFPAAAGASTAPASALCWPPALPLLATQDNEPAGAGAGACAARAEAEPEVTVVLQLPAASASGLRSVRCVLAGPAALDPGGGISMDSAGAAAVAQVDVELPLHVLQQPEAVGGSSDGAVMLAYVRLPVPPSSCVGRPGLRVVHVLPPRSGGTAVAPAMSRASFTASAPGSMNDGPDSGAPLAVVPLLVMGPEAAAELQQLHAEVLGSDAVAQLQQLNTVAIAGPAAAPAEAGSSSSSSGGDALSGAAAALQHSGLTSLVLDFGALLQLPRSDGGQEGTLGDPAAEFDCLLRFLAARRLADCLREAVAALQRAGVRLLLPGEEELVGEEDHAKAEGGEQQRLQAALEFLSSWLEPPAVAEAECGQVAIPAHGGGGRAAAAAGAAAAPVTAPSAAASAVAAPTATAVCPHGNTSRSSVPAGSCPDEAAMPPHTAAVAAVASAAAQPSGGRSVLSKLAWWSRVLAFGFPRAPSPTPTSHAQSGSSSSNISSQRGVKSQPTPEAEYQAYKAASCRRLDCASAILYAAYTALRVATTLRRASQLVVGAPQQPQVAAGGGCPRPYLEGCGSGVTRLHLDFTAQCALLGAAVTAVMLAACTRLHQRRRNALLLLRTALDAAAVLAMTLPLPRWPAPLLGVPQCWLDSNRRTGVHWMVLYGLYEPLTLQLSPYLQALQGLIFVLPMTLLGYHCSGCRWRPALRFGFGHALLGLAVSAATDHWTARQESSSCNSQPGRAGPAAAAAATAARAAALLQPRQARATDIVFVLAEVLLINWLHAVRLGEALHCGAESAAVLPNVSHAVRLYCDGDGRQLGSTGSSRGGSSTFPCGGGLWSKLLWSLSSGAVLDPFLRLRMWDHSNLVYTWAQLAAVQLALLAPALYERCRHALMAGVGVAMLLGVHWSLWAVPSGPFPLNSCILLSAGRRRVGCVYMGWKSATVFRVPAADQLVIGPLLWLLMAAALPMADRRMPPPGSATDSTGGGGGGAVVVHLDGGRRLAVDVLLLFLTIAVLPYVLCSIWEVVALRPAYRKYLLSRSWAASSSSPDAANAAASGGGISSGGAGSGGSGWVCRPVGWSGSSKTDVGRPAMVGPAAAAATPVLQAASADRAVAAVTTAAAYAAVARTAASTIPPHSHDDQPSATGPTRGSGSSSQPTPLPAVVTSADAAAASVVGAARSGQAPVLYRSRAAVAGGRVGRSRSLTALFSVKVPVSHRGFDTGVSSPVGGDELPTFEDASAAVLRGAAAALAAHNTRAAGLAAAGAGAGGGAAGASPHAAAVPLRCLSAVCVRGCVQLLMVLHLVAAADGQQDAEGQDQPPQPPEAQAVVPHVHHIQLPQAAEGVSEPADVLTAAAEEVANAAVQQLLSQVVAGPLTDAAGAAASSSTSVAGTAADVFPAAAGASTAPASALCWPPALPLLATQDNETAGAGAGAARRAEAEPVVTVLLQLPAASASGLRSVRCVLAGPAAVDPGGGISMDSAGAAAVAHVDVELPLHVLQQPEAVAGGSEGGSDGAVMLAYVRLPLPRWRARPAVPGLRMLHVLPPPPPHVGAAATGAAAASNSPFHSVDSITPAWLADGHAGQSAFFTAYSLAGASSSACGTAADTTAGTSAAANTSTSTNAALSNAENAASTRTSMSNSDGGPTRSVVPLAIVPLLVVGSDAAAAELQQLRAEVLGPDAVAQLQQLNTAAVAGPAAAPAEAGCSSSSCAAEALSGAAAALQHSGLTSLALDFGALLQLPRSGASGGATADEGGLGDSVAGFEELLRFLATHRMSGCLREALAALQRAGVWLLLPGAEEEQETEGTGVTTARCHYSVLRERSRGTGEPTTAAAPASHEFRQQRANAAGGGGGAAAAHEPSGEASRAARPQQQQQQQQHLWSPFREAFKQREEATASKPAAVAVAAADDKGGKAEAVATTAAAAFAAQQPSGSLRARLAWWLRVLAFGFPGASPAAPAGAPQAGNSQQQAHAGHGLGSAAERSPEAEYQAYKAASCRRLDCMSLVTTAGFRFVSLMRTCHADAASSPTAAAAASKAALAATSAVGGYAAAIRAAVAGHGLAAHVWRAVQLVVGPARPHADPEPAAGCPRPYLEGCCGGGGSVTSLDLQVVGQAAFLTASLIPVVLALCTRLHQRRRNAFLLLRAGLDAGVMLAMTLPLPRWPAPLLGVPQLWLDNRRCTGVHWLVYGLYEPLTLQVSPRLQALQGLVYLLPRTLIAFHTYDCRWRPALVYGFGHAAAALLVSAATDAVSRVAYLRRARGGAGRGAVRAPMGKPHQL
ncbi:hypothetical protein HXX76_001389 [Chlamydomonas incerta]|uniref:Uncharacterized protein n=1 Tax=Chlamydomonas incerta TaxID=51695 RepID=A0A835WCB7_CHLIN|nr:hypothetical protein HXX76_001389 [Chlamydomonas incerta]|eukprot:KAG2444645.1 hypothetical protein HXX76_001389 [Chlamydomonas incerta]